MAEEELHLMSSDNQEPTIHVEQRNGGSEIWDLLVGNEKKGIKRREKEKEKREKKKKEKEERKKERKKKK